MSEAPYPAPIANHEQRKVDAQSRVLAALHQYLNEVETSSVTSHEDKQTPSRVDRLKEFIKTQREAAGRTYERFASKENMKTAAELYALFLTMFPQQKEKIERLKSAMDTANRYLDNIRVFKGLLKKKDAVPLKERQTQPEESVEGRAIANAAGAFDFLDGFSFEEPEEPADDFDDEYDDVEDTDDEEPEEQAGAHGVARREQAKKHLDELRALQQLSEDAALSAEQRSLLSKIVEGLTVENATAAVEKAAKDASTVPWQTTLLTGAGFLAKAALTQVIKSNARSVLAQTIAASGAVEVAAPAAAGILSFVVDSGRLYSGGTKALYESAAQHTASALTTGWLGAHGIKGSESEAEYKKNINNGRYLGGASGILLFGLRKLGAGLNMFRSAGVQTALGVTRDRHHISEEMKGYESITNQSEYDERLKAEIEAENLEDPESDVVGISWSEVMQIGKRLARLRAMGGDKYGDGDVYGPAGSGLFKVDVSHSAQEMKRYHEALDRVIRESDVLSNKQKEQWIREYDDAERKTKDKLRKFAALTLGSLGAFATASCFQLLKMMGEKLEENPNLFKDWFARVTNSEKNELHSTEGNALDSKPPERIHAPDVVQQPETAPIPDTSTAPDTSAPNTEQPVEAGHSTDSGHETQPTVPDSSTTPDATSTHEAPAVVDTDHVVVGSAVEGQHQTELVRLADYMEDDSQPHYIENAIRSAVVEQKILGTDLVRPNATVNFIKNLANMLNKGLAQRAQPDSLYATLEGNTIPTSLVADSVGYFFTHDQLENLAKAANEAYQLQQAGGDLTDLQEIIVNLGDGNLETIAQVSNNAQLFEQLLTVANQQ